MFELIDYLTEEGRCPLKVWLSRLADRQARARVLVRLQRMGYGNFGDCKPVGDSVFELRIEHGPGYRVYYLRVGEQLLLLLVGGDKRKQTDDIDTAIRYLKDWQRRTRS